MVFLCPLHKSCSQLNTVRSHQPNCQLFMISITSITSNLYPIYTTHYHVTQKLLRKFAPDHALFTQNSDSKKMRHRTGHYSRNCGAVDWLILAKEGRARGDITKPRLCQMTWVARGKHIFESKIKEVLELIQKINM